MCSILISYDLADQTAAMSLRRFLEHSFRNLKVSLSGVDDVTGDTSERLRARIRRADAMICMLSRLGLHNPRLFFEAGMGLAHNHVWVLNLDKLQSGELSAPLSLLPSLELSESGLIKLQYELARVLGLQPPPRHQMLEETLWTIRSFLSQRAQEEAQAQRTPAPTREPEPVDRALASLHRRLKEHVRQAFVNSLVAHAPSEAQLSKERLKSMALQELWELAARYNIPKPEQERALLLAFERELAVEHPLRWKKMNACKLLEAIDEGVRLFERELALRQGSVSA
ncbi:MAG: hypothetical protein ACKO6N_25915 [Myxococcota bacterium]